MHKWDFSCSVPCTVLVHLVASPHIIQESLQQELYGFFHTQEPEFTKFSPFPSLFTAAVHSTHSHGQSRPANYNSRAFLLYDVTVPKREHVPILSYIYLGSSVCHIPVCHPVTIAERSAILLVLIIKLTQETRGRD